MKDWSWLTPLGYILAALVAGGFLLWNSRQRPHDALKTMVEIYKELPDSAARTQLLALIEDRILELTSRSADQTDELSALEEEFANASTRGARLAIAAGVSGLATVVLGAISVYLQQTS